MKLATEVQQYAILYVDDEEKSLQYFSEALDNKFRVFTAGNAQEGYEILKEHQDEIGILITDQRMPGGRGTELLEKSRKLCPRVLRILVTAYTDIDVAVQAINSGAIYKYITKPWRVPELQVTLLRGMEFFTLQKQRDSLLTEKLSAVHGSMMVDRIVSLGLLASGIRHHVNNSLVAVKTFLDLAPAKLKEEMDMDQLRNPDFWKDFHTQSKDSVNKITELFSDLSETSENPVFYYRDHVQLCEVIEDVLEKLQEGFNKKKIQIQQRIGDHLPAMTVDKRRFYRIFELLLKDEISSLPEGSCITLDAELSEDQEYITIRIMDNGPDIPVDVLRSVFDPFFVRSGQPQEFGIYLMACYFMVYHHGGSMEVRTGKMEGNTFIVSLPLHPKEVSSKEKDQTFFNDLLVNESLWNKVLVEN